MYHGASESLKTVQIWLAKWHPSQDREEGRKNMKNAYPVRVQRSLECSIDNRIQMIYNPLYSHLVSSIIIHHLFNGIYTMSTSVPSSPAVLCPVEQCLSRHFTLLGSLEAPTKLIESIESIESRQIANHHIRIHTPCTELSPSTKVCCSHAFGVSHVTLHVRWNVLIRWRYLVCWVFFLCVSFLLLA